MGLLSQARVSVGLELTSLQHNISKRISVQRIVTALLIVAVTFQLPFVRLAPEHVQPAILTNLIASISVFLVVIYFSKQDTFKFARLLLITWFVAFIGYSTWLWNSNHQTHWFLLLGIVIVTYLFSPKESILLYISYLVFAIVFLTFEWHFLTQSNHITLTISDTPLPEFKSFSNAIFMVFACVAVAANIRRFMDFQWHSLESHSLNLQNILDRVFPTTFLPIKDKTHAQTQCFKDVSVLFIDMSCYSEFATNQPLHKHVELLHRAYTVFDRILSDHGIVRVKTNGDQYIAATGIPLTETEHQPINFNHLQPSATALDLCIAAIEIQCAFIKISKQFEFTSQLKMGIASGDVIAGFIGNLRPSFDLWGIPMIVASRLEQHCPDSHIQICADTYKKVRHSSITASFNDVYNFKGLKNIEVYRIDSPMLKSSTTKTNDSTCSAT